MPPISFPHAGENLYGRRTVPEMQGAVTTRRIRRAVTLDNRFYHRAKNGIADPLTFYHIVELLCQMAPGSEFRSVELVGALATFKPQLVWDTTTVGRVMNDIAESLNAGHGFPVIDAVKRWNGMFYRIETGGRTSVALFQLLEDLVALCEEEIRLEAQGRAPKRLSSPMTSCPSVAV